MFAPLTKLVAKASSQEKYFLILLTIFLLVSIPITVYSSLQVRDLRSSAATTTLNRQVGASSDDAGQYGDGIGFSSTDSRLWVEAGISGGDRRNAGIRFTNISIPRGSTINSASIEIYFTGENDDDVSLDIYAHRVDNAPTFSGSDGRDVTSRVTTSASVGWVQTDLREEVWNTSPNIKSVVQEIVNRSGWSSGNATAILLKGKHSLRGELQFRSWDYSGHTSGAKLHITYTPPPPLAPPTVTFSASRTTITRGESTTLRWSTSRATSVSISSIGSVSLSGSKAVKPSSTITYTLTARGSGGTTKKSLTIRVTAPTSSTSPPTVYNVPTTITPGVIPKSSTLLKILLNPLTELQSDMLISISILRTKFKKDVLISGSIKGINIGVAKGVLKKGKSYTLRVEGDKILTKKVGFKMKSTKPKINIGSLYLGDLNRDNIINQSDVEVLLIDFLENRIADLNFDGLVNSIDYSILLKNLGKKGD